MRRHIDRHITTLKGKPGHVRERVALLSAASVTGLVAVIWLASLAGSGALALNSPSDLASDEAAAGFADTKSNFSQLVGAVGALNGAPSEPSLTIVDGETTSTVGTPPPQPPSDATVIPF